MTELSGKVAIVTGGAAGIGLAAVRAFARAGAQVVVADLTEEGCARGVEAAKDAGGAALGVVTDVSDPAAVESLLATAIETYGRLDCLYNNAGGPPRKDGVLTELDREDWDSAFKVDLFGTINCARSAIPRLAASGGGAIINTASCVALRGVAGRDAYVAAKGAVIALTRSMAAELAGMNIRVNAIAPGATSSPRVLELLAHDKRTRAVADRHVLGLVEPEDIAAAAVFLAGDGARRITGQILSVDSGATEIMATDR